MLGRRSGKLGWRCAIAAAAIGLVAAAGCTNRTDTTESSQISGSSESTATAPPASAEGGDAQESADTTGGTTAVAGGEPEISQSVFRVKANRCASPENSWTTGFAVDDRTVATVAHALESTLAVTVIDVDEVEHQVEVAYVDEDKDIALLRLLDTTVQPLAVADAEAAGDVWLVTFKQKEEQPVVRPASVLALLQVTMDGQGARDAIKLTADISVGDSGGPVVNSSGQLLGMIFATTIDEQTGWAIAQPEVSEALATKNANSPEVVPPACLTDPTDRDEGESESADADPTGSE